MKKIVFLAAGLLGLQFSYAQDDTVIQSNNDPDDTKISFYFGGGVAVLGDYNINKNLQVAGMPEIQGTMPELTIGYTISAPKVAIDFELNANYMDDRDNTSRLRILGSGVKLRGHYVPYKTDAFFVSGGLDLSYVVTQFDLNDRSNVIDLNDLDPATQTGHISLNNALLYAGPSVAVGLFQNKSFPVRINVGYDFALTNGKWKSEFANVVNQVGESGHSRFYAKINLPIFN